MAISSELISASPWFFLSSETCSKDQGLNALLRTIKLQLDHKTRKAKCYPEMSMIGSQEGTLVPSIYC
jgi:hypothetical protein